RELARLARGYGAVRARREGRAAPQRRRPVVGARVPDSPARGDALRHLRLGLHPLGQAARQRADQGPAGPVALPTGPNKAPILVVSLWLTTSIGRYSYLAVHQSIIEPMRHSAPCFPSSSSKISWTRRSSSSYSICAPPSFTETSAPPVSMRMAPPMS